MPLKPGHSPDIIQENIHEMIKSGHDPKQAAAAAYHNAELEKRKKKNGAKR